MRYKITPPAHLSSSIILPSSKSISNRVLIINALQGHTCTLHNLAVCDDTSVMQKSLPLQYPNDTVFKTNIGAAGTAMRFLTAYYCMIDGTQIITGTERMRARPIGTLVNALRSMGATIEYEEKEGFPPLRITGCIRHGGILHLPANISSQYVSAILMIVPYLKGGFRLVLTGNITSRPYINMTIKLMQHFGAKISWINNSTIDVKESLYSARDFYVESDWSAASYWYEMVLLSDDDNATVILKGLNRDSLQGDSKVTEYFKRLGVTTHFTNESVIIHKDTDNINISDKEIFDLHGEPDLAQTLAVSCCVKGICFELKGLANLRIKETDRITALTNELKKLGFVIKSDTDGVISWSGERCNPENEPTISTYEDHRMAMSFAPICLCNHSIYIENPCVVTKSYPNFWNDMVNAGFKIEKI